MSVLIKGMEMPNSCLSCDFMMNCDNCEGHECYCTVLNRSIGYLPSSSDFLCDGVSFVHSDDRLEDCPLVPVPDHGRLIDADALENRVVPASRFFEIPNANVVVLGVIKAAPTIIPQSEEGE